MEACFVRLSLATLVILLLPVYFFFHGKKTTFNGSQLAKMKKYIPYMSVP